MPKVLGEMISHLQHHFFVGREHELQTLMHHVTFKNEARVVNIYGIAGVGKSTLLDEFQRSATIEGLPVIRIDSLDFKHTKEDFCRAITLGISESVTGDYISSTIDCLNRIGYDRTLILMIDTYEELHELDTWLREHFLPKLLANILIVLAGRMPLRGKWITSNGWREMVKQIELKPFSEMECQSFLGRFNLKDEGDIERYYKVTNGHPLALTLAAGLGLEYLMINSESPTLYEVLQETTAQWLRELPDVQLGSYIEAAAIVRLFDHDLLESILNTKITSTEFSQLTSLSFTRKNRQGWSIHNLLRSGLIQEMKIRSPLRLQTYFSKAIEHYLHLIKVSPAAGDLIGELLYVLGDSHLRSTYLDDSQENKYYLAPVMEENIAEAVTYVKELQKQKEDLIDEFYDTLANETHKLLRPYKADEKLLSFIDFKEFIALGGGRIRLLKDENHQSAGLMIMLPIHKGTISYLLKKPITRNYFKTMDKATKKEIIDAREECSGWFIFHIDLKKDNSPPARAKMFQEILTYFLKGGFFVFTTPIAYMQETVKRIGFEEVPNSLHYDFGEEYPAPYYQIDLRGDKRHQYASRLVQNAGISFTSELPTELKALTPRELEVTEMVLTHNTIAEMANALYVTQITVKKHLSRIYEKLEVSNKAELIKKLYIIGFNKNSNQDHA